MKHMNLSKKLSLTALTAALAICASPAAYAIIPITLDVPNGFYTFEATDGNNALNGSWVEFSGDTISQWDLMDADVGPDSKFPPTTIPLNNGNSTASFDVYDGHPGEWDFTITTTDPAVYYYDFFEASDNEPSGTGFLYDGFGDPQGVWNFDANLSVPDASSSITLLAGSVTALGACRSFLRRRSSRN